jgi:tetratricopeptide (TPR) repeat protein
MRARFLYPNVIGWLCLLVSVPALSQIMNRNDSSNATSGASRGNHSIRGKIFLPSGRLPEHRMRVVLELASGGIYGETFSDSVGGFEFRSLPNNTYRVIVPSDGQTYDKAEEYMEISGSSARTFTAQLYLRVKDSDNRLTSNHKMISAGEFAQDIPKAAKKSYEQGIKKLKDGKSEEAFTHFQDALKMFPDYVAALNKVGEYQVGKQQMVEAEATLKRAAEISPKYPYTHVNLGMLMVQLKRYPEAIEFLEAANKLDESFPMAHLNLGVALLEKTPQQNGDLERAEQEFNKALAMGGTSLAYVHKFLFNIHVRRHDYNRAATELEAYLKDAPDAPDISQVQQMLIKTKKAAQSAPPKPQ